MGYFGKRRATRLLMVMVSHPVHAESFTAEEAVSLIAQGASASALMPGGSSPLIHACEWGNLGVAEVLLRNGADPNGIGQRKHMPLHAAAINGHNALIDLLVERGADINAQGAFGATALHHAVVSDVARRRGTAEKLVQLGADPSRRNEDGQTPLAAFQELVDVIVGHPPVGKETQTEKYRTDQSLQKELDGLSLLLGRA